MIASQRMIVHGIDLEVLRGGDGDPIVLLHGMRSLTAASRFPALLAAHGTVRRAVLSRIRHLSPAQRLRHDLRPVHLQRALLDAIPGERITLVGLSFGGWLAAEVAAQGHPRLARLVLVDPVGIKISDRETADILDVFNRSPAAVRRAAWHDPDRFAPDFDAMEDAEIVRHARDWEALCRYAWHPYMYNPRLPAWLGRIAVPALVVWGDSDGIVSPDYGRAFARLIPGARFEMIAGAGHHPEIERPEELARVDRFIREGLTDATLVSQRKHLSVRPTKASRRSRIRSAPACPAGCAIRRSPPICSISAWTNCCCATISASTSSRSSIMPGSTACTAPVRSCSARWRGRPGMSVFCRRAR